LITAIVFVAGLGVFMDATQKPHKADIIVSLGGGDGKRIKEAVKLYQQGYSKSGIFLYTGREIVNPALKPPKRFSKRAYLISHGIPADKIVYVPRGVIFNTAEELFFIKDYLHKKGFHSALIVSTAVHTRRIKTLAHYISNYDDANLTLYVTSYHPKPSNPWLYFLDPAARSTVWLEFEKLIYNLLKYSPFTIDKTAYSKKKDTPLWKETLDQ